MQQKIFNYLQNRIIMTAWEHLTFPYMNRLKIQLISIWSHTCIALCYLLAELMSTFNMIWHAL